MIGNDHLGGTGVGMDPHLFDLGRRESLRHEVGRLVAERHDVDLLAPQFVDDLADAPTSCTDAGTHGIDVAVVGPHRDLGAMAWLTRTGLDLDGAVGDLGDLELEQLEDETRVRPRHDDLRSFGRLAHLDDVGLEPCARVRALGLRQQGLDPTEVEQGVAAVALLDDPGDDVALAAGVLLVLQLAFGFTDALHHDLLGGLRSDTAEVGGGHVELAAHRFAVLVELLRMHPDLEGVRIYGDPRVLVGLRHALVGRLQRVGQSPEQGVDRDALVCGQRLQRLHHVGVAHACTPFRRDGAPSADRTRVDRTLMVGLRPWSFRSSPLRIWPSRPSPHRVWTPCPALDRDPIRTRFGPCRWPGSRFPASRVRRRP